MNRARIRKIRGVRFATALALIATLASLTSRAADAPAHNISAANINVIQNDSANTEASVTATTTLSINDLRVRTGSNRGDINVQVGDTGTNDLEDGFILTSISQNGRYNLDEASEPIYGAPAFDGNGNGFWAVLQDVTSDRAEYNANCAVAYFRYTNWLSGWARNANRSNGATNNFLLASPGLLLGTHFKGIKAGESRVDLRAFGIGSTNAGVLLVNHAKNEGNFALSVANPDGTWELYVKDNFGSANNPLALEQDPVAFVFIPKTNTTVVSGKFGLDETGTNALILIHSGEVPTFAVTNIATGRYRLTIPGATPASGVLITSCEGGYTNNFDNVVSYEPDGDGWIIESRDTGVYPPELEACTNEPVASFVFIPSASPGFTVNPTNTLLTTESGVTASFTVVLDLAPTNDVTINVSSSNPAEGLAGPSSLTFNPTNWNIPQMVTVTGQDDAIADGPVNYSILLAPAISDDLNYNGLDPADVSVINADDEQPGISVTPTAGLVTTEAGGAATFQVFLNRQPAADVTVGISSDNLSEGTVSPGTLTFTPSDWNTPKTVTVTGADDFKQDGNTLYTIITAPATSADGEYNGFDASDVTVMNIDNDRAGYVWNYSLPLTVVEGSAINYSLSLGTQPESNVVVQVSSDNTSAGTVSPATLTFTPLDWNTPHDIQLSGVDNLVTNASVTFNVKHQPVTTDPVYSQMVSPITVPAILLDNEAKFDLSSGDCIFGIGMPPIGIDGQATIEDPDAVSYENGNITAAFLANGQATDQLAIRNSGSAPGQIGVSGSSVTYGGTEIGTLTGGNGLNPLVVSLNANASVPAVQQLVRSITFHADGSSFVTRSLAISLNDGLGVTVGAMKPVRVGALRMTEYQEGADHGYGEYHGAADIALSQVGYDKPWPAGRTPAPQEGLLIDWPDGGTPNESQVLLRFDDFLGTNYWQVPTGAIVVSAELLVNVNNTGDGGRFFRMLIPWDAENDTWSSLGDGVQSDDLEARSVYDSQLGVEDGSGATGTGIISIGVTHDVQAWANGETNYGWVIKGWPLRTDGTGFTPSEYGTITERPRLRVKWLMPNYTLVSFRQGIDGYAGTFDTNLRQATPDTVYSTEDTIWSDANDAGNTNATDCLIRFDNIIGTATNQIPAGAQIIAAMLDLASVGTDAMGDGGQIFGVLQPWDDTTTTWNSWGDGIQPDGIEAALTPTATAGTSDRNPDVQGTVNSYEVTADVQAWVNGTRPNYGWAILPWTSGNNGWGNRSAEFYSYVDPNDSYRDCPQLRVYYTVSSIAVPAVLSMPVLSANQAEFKFSGTVGKTYSVYRAATLTGPWNMIGTATVEATGEVTFTDTTPLLDGAFYKVSYP